MKIQRFNDEASWLEARLGKITGTRLKDLVGKEGLSKPKIGFYEIIAERIAIPPSQENAMDRGKRLEEVAVEQFSKEIKKKINTDLVLWCREDDENIAVSPDGSIGKTIAVEVKCLSSARHIEAFMTKEIPKEYDLQALQYFVVNEKLKTLYFVFYDPRMPKDMFWITLNRKDIQERVKEYLILEKTVLLEIEKKERELTF